MLTKEEGGRHIRRPQFYFRTTDVTGTVTLRKYRDGDAGRQPEVRR
ncbi:hypothetical protein [Marivita cryptomonadis]